MAAKLNRYLEDLTGISPNNKVVNDVYELSVKDIRAVAVHYGPFYIDSLTVTDNVTNLPLRKDIDYSPVGLLPELTARTGKGVYDSLLIVNKSVSNKVRLDYQTVGGDYLNQAKTISDLTEAAIRDGRPVDWQTGVLNKQLVYPPSIHSHWLNDVVGWGPVVAALDRVSSAITIGQAPIFNFLLSRLDLRRATLQEVLEGTSDNKFISPEVFKQAITNVNFNAMYLIPYVKIMHFNQSQQFKLASNLPDAFDKMWWKIEHETTTDSDFQMTSAEFQMEYGQGSFSIKPVAAEIHTESKFFRVIICKDTSSGPVMIKSLRIEIPPNDGDPHAGISTERMNALYSSCCLFDVENKDPIGMFFSEQ